MFSPFSFFFFLRGSCFHLFKVGFVAFQNANLKYFVGKRIQRTKLNFVPINILFYIIYRQLLQYTIYEGSNMLIINFSVLNVLVD